MDFRHSYHGPQLDSSQFRHTFAERALITDLRRFAIVIERDVADLHYRSQRSRGARLVAQIDRELRRLCNPVK